MNLIAYRPQNPYNVVDEIKEWMEHSLPQRPARPSHYAPRVNAWEQENEFVMEMEVPGFKDEDISLEVLNDQLVVKGTVTRNAKEAPPEYKIWEFERTGFERSFRLGEVVDQEKISAKIENGMLFVTLPKKEKAQPRKITITPGT